MDESAAINPAAASAAAPTNPHGPTGDATRRVTVWAAYLARAFVWMAAGLVLSAVELAGHSSEQLEHFAASNFRYLVIAQPQHAGSL